MKPNMGTLDRSIRTILALVVAALYITGKLTGTAAIILGIIAVIFLVTGIIGFCPLYVLLGFKTIREKEE